MKEFKEPEVKVIALDSRDVIATSNSAQNPVETEEGSVFGSSHAVPRKQ